MNCSSISFTWQLTCVNGSDKHILLSNANSNRSYLTMYKLLTRQISFRTKKPKKKARNGHFLKKLFSAYRPRCQLISHEMKSKANMLHRNGSLDVKANL